MHPRPDIGGIIIVLSVGAKYTSNSIIVEVMGELTCGEVLQSVLNRMNLNIWFVCHFKTSYHCNLYFRQSQCPNTSTSLKNCNNKHEFLKTI